MEEHLTWLQGGDVDDCLTQSRERVKEYLTWSKGGGNIPLDFRKGIWMSVMCKWMKHKQNIDLFVPYMINHQFQLGNFSSSNDKFKIN